MLRSFYPFSFVNEVNKTRGNTVLYSLVAFSFSCWVTGSALLCPVRTAFAVIRFAGFIASKLTIQMAWRGSKRTASSKQPNEKPETKLHSEPKPRFRLVPRRSEANRRPNVPLELALGDIVTHGIVDCSQQNQRTVSYQKKKHTQKDSTLPAQPDAKDCRDYGHAQQGSVATIDRYAGISTAFIAGRWQPTLSSAPGTGNLVSDMFKKQPIPPRVRPGYTRPRGFLTSPTASRIRPTETVNR